MKWGRDAKLSWDQIPLGIMGDKMQTKVNLTQVVFGMQLNLLSLLHNTEHGYRYAYYSIYFGFTLRSPLISPPCASRVHTQTLTLMAVPPTPAGEHHFPPRHLLFQSFHPRRKRKTLWHWSRQSHPCSWILWDGAEGSGAWSWEAWGWPETPGRRFLTSSSPVSSAHRESQHCSCGERRDPANQFVPSKYAGDSRGWVKIKRQVSRKQHTCTALLTQR